jgi:hypothetical protein
MRRSVAARVEGIIGGADAAAERIVALYRSAGSAERELGAAWYADARFRVGAMSAVSGRSARLVSSVLAVLSPRCGWSRNLAACASLLDDPESFPDGPLFANQVKAWRILVDGEDPRVVVRGPKVTRFWRACDPTRRHDGSVVVDVWALRAAVGREVTESEGKIIGTESGYRVVERAYQGAARRLNLPCHVVQATVWIVVRGGHD